MTDTTKWMLIVENAADYLADTYSASAPYSVGDFVVYGGKLYECNTAIETAEAWTAAHWTETTFADAMRDFEHDIVLIQAAQPTSEDNRFWIPTEVQEEHQVPTYAEFEEARNDLDVVQTLVKEIGKEQIITTPAILQELAASGGIGDYLEIGDVITIPWTDNSGSSPVEYQYPFVVADIADCYDENGVLHKNALWLMAMYATTQNIPFDAAEDTVVDLTTEPNALDGWYYWGLTGSDQYTALNLTAGDVIPTTYDSVHKCGINNLSILRYGYNRWSMCAYRQWLNSDAAKNEGWWESQNFGDVAPSATITNYPGWLNGFTSEWKAIFKPVKVDTACNTVTDGGVTDTTYDTFFLPSLEQMYGAPQAAGIEGKYWPYWKEETGLDVPSNGSSTNTNDAWKIPSVANPTGSPMSCRLRSADRGSSYSAWYVYSAGYLYYYVAYYGYRALPACVIY